MSAPVRRPAAVGMRGSRSPEPMEAYEAPGVTEALMLAVARLVGRLLTTALAHPVVTLSLVVLSWVTAVAGVGWAIAMLTGLAAGLLVWRQLHRASYRRLVTSRVRGTWVYRRRWQPAMVTCGLVAMVNGREYLPSICRVITGEYGDRLLVELLSGQSPEDWEQQTTRLAHTFDATRCRVVTDRPGRVWVEFTHTDPLAETIRALEPADVPDLAALPVGVCEDGEPWRLRLAGAHLLIAGATGSGKGSVLWSLIRAMGPAIRDRCVEVWAVDPKGGMELSPGAGLFTRFAYADAASMVRLLEEAVEVMRQRAERLRQAGQRTHLPTSDEPLVVVLVDELAALTAYCGDRDLKKRAEAALQVLLSQGRAPGVSVVAAVQDPGKDVIGFRDLFPTRIALRLLEDVQVDMVLGRSARLHGGECDQIPANLPGVGYMLLDGVREPVRVRAAYVSDDDLAEMIERFAPQAGVVSRRAAQAPPFSTTQTKLRVVDQ
ncbi:MAG TPA: FtsK/SpoIIIE domain-containing protein [Nocardioidaceae bacterium]|nr:FtsK/SpoIIIE domain-containing protein [Nocardioidaceae bacterium]